LAEIEAVLECPQGELNEDDKEACKYALREAKAKQANDKAADLCPAKRVRGEYARQMKVLVRQRRRAECA
jgi:hypothetical protein